MKKICFRCKKEILDAENYYSFVEHNNMEIINTDYAHRKCWDEHLEHLQSLKNAQSIIDSIGGSLHKMGLIKEKEEKYQIV